MLVNKNAQKKRVKKEALNKNARCGSKLMRKDKYSSASLRFASLRA